MRLEDKIGVFLPGSHLTQTSPDAKLELLSRRTDLNHSPGSADACLGFVNGSFVTGLSWSVVFIVHSTASMLLIPTAFA